MGYSKYVGRVGALAVALGVGCAVASPAGFAWAETTDAASSSETGNGTDTSATVDSAADPTSSPAAETPTAGGAGDTSGPADPDSPDAPAPQPSSPTAQTDEVAPGVVVSSSGGAQTSTGDDEPATDDTPSRDKPSTSDGHERVDADNNDDDTSESTTSPATQASAQTVRVAQADPVEPVTVTPELVNSTATADVALSVIPAPTATTPATVPAPVATINAVLTAFVTPMLSRFFGALPGAPESSPLGWIVLAAARRQLGADSATPALAMDSAPATMSLVTAAADLPPAVEVIVDAPVEATGAVSGRVVADDPEDGTLTYTVTTPPSSGKLVFDSATAKFVYTPTTAQRIAALTGTATIAMTVTVSDGVNSVATVVDIPVAAFTLDEATQIGGLDGAHAIAVSGTRAYVTNKAAGTVTVIDTVTNTVIKTIAVGATPDGIAVKSDGSRIYVSSSEANTVKVLNTATGAVVKTISIAKPSALALHPNGSVLYVTSLDAGTVRKVNLTYYTTATVKLPAGSRPTGIVFSPDKTKMYVISGNAGAGGSVALVGSTSATIVANLASAPTSLAISPDNKRLFVTSVDGTLRVIDAASRAVLATHHVGGVPAGITVSADGSTLLVANTAGVVSALDAATGALLDTLATRPSANPMSLPPRIVQSADGTSLYVTDYDADVVRVVALPAINSAPQVGTPDLAAPNAATGAIIGTVGVTDPDPGDTLKYTLATAPKKGTVKVNADGTFTYTPTAAARHAASATNALPGAATDSFTVTVTDAKGATALATVVVDILPANKVPVVTVSVGTPNTTTGVVTGKVSATDGDNDVRTVTTTTPPTKGTVVVNASTGAFTYTPTAAARHAAAKLGAPAGAMSDTFSVTVSDGHGGLVVKTITVSVRPANATPTTPTVQSDTNTNTGIVTGTVKLTDADGDALSYSATQAAKGELTMRSDGTFTYRPTTAARLAAAAPGATAATKTDVVTVTVTDGFGATVTTQLTLNVAPALPSSGYQASDPTLAIGTVTGKITAIDPATGVSYTVTGAPTKGLVKVDAATGTFVYVPNVDARYTAQATTGVDTDTFTVTVTDALGLKTPVAVTVEVAPPLTSAMDQRSTTIAVTAQEMYFFSQSDTDKALDLLKAAGVTNIRILVPWMGVEAINDWWSWGGVDRMVNGAYARNIEVLAVLNSPPIWASVPDVPILAGRPASPAEFAEYAGMVAARYAGKISAYEIWNEPNYWGFWAPGPNAAQYTEILKAAYPVIKAADPNAVVLAGSVASVIDFGNITVNPVRYIKEMYAAGAAGYFDAIAFHPYLYGLQFSKGGSTVNAPLWQAKEIYKLMVANGDGNKKIWATEYGQPSHLVSEDSQAAFIADFLRSWRTLSFAGPAFIQTIKDNTESDPNAANMGLLRADWTPKPALGVVTAIILENLQLLT